MTVHPLRGQPPTDVDVVIPCRDGGPFLGEALASVLTQEPGPRTVIVVDDGSTDGSREVAAGFGPPVRVEANPRRGGCAARNHGASLAEAEFLLFMDADDLLPPGALSAMREALRLHPEADFATCEWRPYLEVGGRWRVGGPHVGTRPRSGDPLRDWLRGWYTPPVGLLWRRTSLVAGALAWDEELTQNQDGDFAMRAMVGGLKPVAVPGGCVLYRRQPPGVGTVSTARDEASFRSRLRVYDRIRALLEERGRLATYRVDLGQSYHTLARTAVLRAPGIARVAEAEALRLAGVRRLGQGSVAHAVGVTVLGLERKERLAARLARLRARPRPAVGGGA